jgi:hypothetical protein
LSEKRRFWRFTSQKVRKTARFFAVFVHSGRHGGIFDSFDSHNFIYDPGMYSRYFETVNSKSNNIYTASLQKTSVNSRPAPASVLV